MPIFVKIESRKISQFYTQFSNRPNNENTSAKISPCVRPELKPKESRCNRVEHTLLYITGHYRHPNPYTVPAMTSYFFVLKYFLWDQSLRQNIYWTTP